MTVARWWRANWGRLVGEVVGVMLLTAAIVLAASVMLGAFAVGVGVSQLVKWIVGF